MTTRNEFFTICNQHKTLLIWEGILCVILGCLAITMPIFTSFVVDYVLGCVLLVAALTQFYRAFAFWNARTSWAMLLSALIALLAGGILLVRPMAGLFALTTLLLVYFLLSGCAKIWAAFKLGGGQRFWIGLSGVLSLILAAIIFASMPQVALWVPGLLVGIDLLFFGIMTLSFSTSLPGKRA